MRKSDLIVFVFANCIFATMMLLVFFWRGDFSEHKHENQPMQTQFVATDRENDVDVCVITLQFGDRHLLLWSNREATATEDGTITIQTRSEGDFQ